MKLTSITQAAAVMAAALLLAVLLVLIWNLPDRPLTLSPPTWQQTRPVVIGAFHVHSRRSDGSGTPDDIAAAAARAGLHFVIFTDHGDATRSPDPPQYRSGVLCIDAVEITTTAGHYIAVGIPASPYPLGGEPHDVIEDVRRLGGFGVVAHPDSAKPALQWREWTAPFDALEWLNEDSAWRDDGAWRVATSLVTYPFRPMETLGALLDRPENALLRWDALTGRRRVVALAGTDAHARVGLQDQEPYRTGWFLRLPSYEISFRTFSLRVNLERPWSGDAKSDADLLIRALRDGHVYTGIDAIASPAVLDFSATSGRFSAQQGDLLPLDGPIMVTVRVNAQAGATIVLRRDGKVIHEAASPELRFQPPTMPGAYRVEVQLRNAPGQPTTPWLVSNPIYVEPTGWGTPAIRQRPAAVDTQEIRSGGWHVEQAGDSSSQITDDAADNWKVGVRYRLGNQSPGTYVSLAVSIGNALTRFDRMTFRAQSARPMRMSVQARRQIVGERWQRSIFLDDQPRDVTIFFDDMTPIGRSSTWLFNPAQIDTLMFVVDATNTTPGSEGEFSISRLRLER